MIKELLTINFAPMIGLLFLVAFLFSDKEMDEEVKNTFFALCFLEVLEMIFYSMELRTATFEKPSYWRIFFSAMGYSIRPFLLLGILRLAIRGKIKPWEEILFSVPAILNVIVAFSAFFTGIAYSYNDRNQFERGPLGYTTHIVLFFYLICVLLFSFTKGKKRIVLENSVLWIACGVIVTALLVETVYSVRSLGRTAIVLSTFAYYLYFQTRGYREEIKEYITRSTKAQKEHLREMNVISVLANEYVSICYVDVEKNSVIAYRLDPVIREQYGEVFEKGVTYEQILSAYILGNIYEDDRAFFTGIAKLPDMCSYLQQNGSFSKKYRVLRNGAIVYCEMRAELIETEGGVKDIVVGFSNNDMRVRREMVYQSTVQEEIDKVERARNSLSGIAELARKLEEAIDENLSTL